MAFIALGCGAGYGSSGADQRSDTSCDEAPPKAACAALLASEINRARLLYDRRYIPRSWAELACCVDLRLCDAVLGRPAKEVFAFLRCPVPVVIWGQPGRIFLVERQAARAKVYGEVGHYVIWQKDTGEVEDTWLTSSQWRRILSAHAAGRVAEVPAKGERALFLSPEVEAEPDQRLYGDEIEAEGTYWRYLASRARRFFWWTLATLIVAVLLLAARLAADLLVRWPETRSLAARAAKRDQNQ